MKRTKKNLIKAIDDVIISMKNGTWTGNTDDCSLCKFTSDMFGECDRCILYYKRSCVSLKSYVTVLSYNGREKINHSIYALEEIKKYIKSVPAKRLKNLIENRYTCGEDIEIARQVSIIAGGYKYKEYEQKEQTSESS